MPLPSMPMGAAPKKKSLGKVIAIILGILAVVVVLPILFFVFSLFKGTSVPMGVAKDFLTSVADGEYATAYELTSTELQSVATVEGLQLFAESYPVLDNLADINFTSRGFENEVVYFAGTIVDTSGEESPITVQLLKENGEWKVVFFSLNAEDVPVIE